MQRKDVKILFMGTPEFAACSLKSLVESGYSVVGAFTNPDKPSGRGMKMCASAVKEYAINNNIPVFQPIKVRNNLEVIDILNELKPDVICVVAYGKILPKEILDYPKFGAINVHGSLLPKYRGAAPIQWSVINGDETTGITTMFMDIGMDTGDMLLKEEVEIAKNDNYGTVHDKLMLVGAKLLVETLDKVIDGSCVRIKQPDEFSLAPMISKEMTKIDFNKTSAEVFNFVRGLSPFPGTYMKGSNDRVFKVYNVEVVKEADIELGVLKDSKASQIVLVSKDKLYIKCKDGYISILEIQPQNSKRMNIVSFLAGNKIDIGESFGY